MLSTKPRGQGYQAQSHAQVVRAACRRWRNGEVAALWAEAKKRAKGPRTGGGRRARGREAEPTQEQKNLKRVATLLQEGQFSRASKALISRGIDQNSAEARAQMVDKHPTVEVAPTPAEENPSQPITLTSRQVYEAIRGFKAGTAPGPSGLRAEHLKEAKAARTEGRGAAALSSLTRLVNTMASGKVAAGVAPYLCGGNLFAAVKKDGGYRPVAVGDILRRLTSKCVAYAVAARASNHLRPFQYGVGVRGGCEGMVHATRGTMSDTSIPQEDRWLLQVDFTNGFNQISRAHMFAEVRAHFPDISHWVELAYGEASVLNFGAGSILSTAGVHQGDPMGPMLWAVTHLPIAKKIQEEVAELKQNCWFLDDGALVAGGRRCKRRGTSSPSTAPP